MASDLAAALRAGKVGGADAAEELLKVVGPSADLALVVQSLQAASAVLQTQAQAQVLNDNPLPPPPNVPMHYGGRTEFDMTHHLLQSMVALQCTESKLALACTCWAWHRALWHPAFWKTFQLPAFSGNTKLKKFVERQLQRFQRTDCVWLSLPSFKISDNTIYLLFQIAPKLRELIVYSNDSRLGDDFVNAMDRAGYHAYHTYESSEDPKKSKPFYEQLKRLTFRHVWLSSRSRFVAKVSGAAGPAFRPKEWVQSLEQLTFFNIPPSKQRHETSKQIIYSMKPLEQTTCDLCQGLSSLSSMTLQNPASGIKCVVDVSEGRLGLEPPDRHAYREYAQSMPAPPSMKLSRGRGRLPFSQRACMGSADGKEYINADIEYAFEQPSAEWVAVGSPPDLRPLEPKSAKGRRVLIPQGVWPDYACTENAGAGWSAIVKSCTAAGVARVHFETATDEEGRACPDEHLKLTDLRPR